MGNSRNHNLDSQKWYATHKEQHYKATKRWRDRNPIKWKEIIRKANWKKMGLKITIDQYKELYEQQNYECAICGTKADYLGLDLDHDHTTNEIRGLLCFKCNNGLGSFQDSISSLTRAVNYLKEHSNGRHSTMV